MFKNAQIYRITGKVTAAQLEAALASQVHSPIGNSEMERMGWVAPRVEGLVYSVQGHLLIQLLQEKRLLPSKVVNQVAKARAAELEEQQGFAPGKKAMKELKERVHDELLPRSHVVRADTRAWIDSTGGWMVVDAASPSKADDIVKMLLKAVDRFPLESLRVQSPPVRMMTSWLELDESPAGFTIDQDATLKASGESKAQVAYRRHTLEPGEMQRHIAAGKQCTRLAMTWDSKISFVLTEALAIKSIKLLDVMKEVDSAVRNDAERFDGEFLLFAGEFSKLLGDLTRALGGMAEEARAA